MKRLLLLLLIVLCLTACSNKKTIITMKLPQESSKEETENRSGKDNKIHIYQHTYHTYVSNNSNGGLSIFNPSDDNRIQFYQYDSKKKKYSFEKIDYRYNFHETYAELSSEKSKIVDGSLSPNGNYVIIEERGDANLMQYYVLNTSNNTKQPLLSLNERYKNGQLLYQLQFAWSEDGKKLAYGIQLRDLNLSHPSYYAGGEEFSKVYIKTIEDNRVVYSFHRHNLNNSSVIYNYKLSFCDDSNRLIVYNNSYLGKVGNNQISIVDMDKKGKQFASNVLNSNAYNSKVTYQKGKLYRINDDHTLSMLDFSDDYPMWNHILYRENNVVAYIPFKNGKQFIVVEDAKSDLSESTNEGAEYNIYLSTQDTNTRKLLYKTSNPFLSIRLNTNEDILLLESMMPYYNSERYVEAELITTVIQF